MINIIVLLYNMDKFAVYFNDNKLIAILIIVILFIVTFILYTNTTLCDIEHFCSTRLTNDVMLKNFIDAYVNLKIPMNLKCTIKEGTTNSIYYLACIDSTYLGNTGACDNATIVLINEKNINTMKQILYDQYNASIKNCIAAKWVSSNESVMTEEIKNKYKNECERQRSFMFDFIITPANGIPGFENAKNKFIISGNSDKTGVTLNHILKKNVIGNNPQSSLCANNVGSSIGIDDTLFEIVPDPLADTSNIIPTVINNDINFKLKVTKQNALYVGLSDYTVKYNNPSMPQLNGIEFKLVTLLEENSQNVIHFTASAI